jgi:ADP-heptose:LPS heptosyltransferase
LDTWDTIFGKTNIVISADSWTSHFAAILDKPQIVFYGPTNARDVNCKCNFNKQNNKVLLFNTIAECAPCNVFKCVKTKGHCLGFNIDEKEIKDYCNQY